MAEYLQAVDEYEGAAQAALNAKDALEELTSGEACDDSSAFDAALAAYRQAQESFEAAEAKYEGLADLFAAAQSELAEVAGTYQAYYDALDAQTAAQAAADSYNALVDQLSDLLANFPEIEVGDNLLVGDPAGSYYEGQFQAFFDWLDEFEALIPELQPALDALVDAADAFETANAAYNASGIAPAGNPVGSLVVPADFETVAEAALTQIEDDVEDADEQIRAYKSMLAAALLFHEQYNQYVTTVTEADEALANDGELNDYLLSLSLTRGGIKLDLLGLPADFLDQIATVENLQELVEAYETHVWPLVDQGLVRLDDALDMTNNYDTWQDDYRDALDAFMDATGATYTFVKASVEQSKSTITYAMTNTKDAYDFNVGQIDSRKNFVDGDLTLDDLFQGGNWKTATDYFFPVRDSGLEIEVPGFKLSVSDIEGVSLLEIIAPADAPEPPSALPDLLEPLDFSAPENPCQPTGPTPPTGPTTPSTGPTPPTGTETPKEPGDSAGLAVTGAKVGGVAALAATLLAAGLMLTRRSKSEQKA